MLGIVPVVVFLTSVGCVRREVGRRRERVGRWGAGGLGTVDGVEGDFLGGGRYCDGER
jgi:hypothetical protein